MCMEDVRISSSSRRVSTAVVVDGTGVLTVPPNPSRVGLYVSTNAATIFARLTGGGGAIVAVGQAVGQDDDMVLSMTYHTHPGVVPAMLYITGVNPGVTVYYAEVLLGQPYDNRLKER